jgi:hypothetical protein
MKIVIVAYKIQSTMSCSYCYKQFKSNHTPIYLQTSTSTYPYHTSCAKKQLYSYVLEQIQENEVHLSDYRTTTRSIWPSKQTLRLCIYHSPWYQQVREINQCIKQLEYYIDQQVYQ